MFERRDLQEHVFVLLMLALAFLYRENPILVYPQVLSLLFVLLSFNFFQHWYLQRTRYPLVFHAFALIVNTLLVAGVIQFSGGKDSSFWVLLLLPLFSSVIMHHAHTIWLTLVMVLTALISFYLAVPVNLEEATTVLVFKDSDIFGFFTKAGVLTLALFVVKRLAVAEQTAKIALEEQRGSLKSLENKVEDQSMQTDKMVNLGHLTASIAHDLNSPIALILGYSDLLLADLPKESKQTADVKRIKDAATFCRSLISNILGMARREDYTFEPTDIRYVYENTIKLCETAFRHHQVRCDTNFEEGIPAVPMSPIHIQQVLLNLLTNASHVTKTGGTVTITARRKDGSLAVSVRDQGPGLKEGLEKDIFKAFVTTKEKGKGTGLGLSTAKKIVEAHHGAIEVQNSPDGGAVFTFTLPMEQKSLPGR